MRGSSSNLEQRLDREATAQETHVEVSISTHRDPHSPGTNVENFEVVSVQRKLLCQDLDDTDDDTEEYSQAHVLHERVDVQSKQKNLTLRFEDGSITEICAGAVI